jgi:hypothetical protein
MRRVITRHARRAGARVATALLAIALLAGCVTQVARLDPALFPRQAAAPHLDTTAVRLEVADPDQRVRTARLAESMTDLELPIGRIVEAAGRLALAAEFAASPDAAIPDPRALRLRVASVAADVDSRWAYIVPLGPVTMSRADATTRLRVDVQLLGGADATVRWTQRYDSGVEPVTLQRHGLWRESEADGVQRRLHEQAARLMRQVAGDLRAWLEPQRRLERVL